MFFTRAAPKMRYLGNSRQFRFKRPEDIAALPTKTDCIIYGGINGISWRSAARQSAIAVLRGGGQLQTDKCCCR